MSDFLGFVSGYLQVISAVTIKNISHDVTDCTFCDWKMNWSVSLAKFLSHIENITVEKTEDVKRIEIDRTDPWVEWGFIKILSTYLVGQTSIRLGS